VKRIIDILRKHYPGDWKYDARTYSWVGPFVVRVYSESAARCDAEIDSRFVSIYRREDTQHVVPELLGCGGVYYV
jgi:hypothetical protein